MSDFNFSRTDPERQDNERERSIIPGFVSLQYHLTLLVRFLIEFVPTPEEVEFLEWDRSAGQMYWLEPQNTLFLAASIKQIDTHFGIIDDSSAWCSSAYEYDKAVDELISQYVFEVTRFMWVWMSFEHIVDKLNPGDANSRHRRAMALMQDDRFSLSCDGDRLRDLLGDVCPSETYSEAFTKAKNSNAISRLHYFLCKEIRNSMIHSPPVEIEPGNWDEEDEMYQVENDDRVARFRIATRLVLLIAQEILVLYLRRSPEKTDIDDNAKNNLSRNGILSGVELWRALKFIHLTEPFGAASQLELGI